MEPGPAAGPAIVLKLGGSLTRDGDPEALLVAIGCLRVSGWRPLVVPGGGAFADRVRRRRLGLSEAHWAAVHALDRMAGRLTAVMTRLGVGAAVVRDVDGIERAHERARVPVLAPLRWLRSADPLPHGWHVTSDSIAAWVADELNAQLLVLLKSVDGVVDVAGAVAVEAARDELGDVVDGYFGRALGPGTDCWIINGRHPERLSVLLAHGTTVGTWVRRSPHAGIARAAY